MTGVFIALLLFFLVFIMGLGLLLFPNRIITWSEHNFSPLLNEFARKVEGKYYKPSTTPRPLRIFAAWFLRLAGVIFIASSAWVIYFIASNLIRYLD